MQHRIHVIEDDAKLAELLCRQLERYGYPVSCTKNWKALDEEVKLTKPSLILLDINLPYYDGFYWCSRIRRFSKVPVLFISARDSGMDQVLAIDNGGDDYLTNRFKWMWLSRRCALFYDGHTENIRKRLQKSYARLMGYKSNPLTIRLLWEKVVLLLLPREALDRVVQHPSAKGQETFWFLEI